MAYQKGGKDIITASQLILAGEDVMDRIDAAVDGMRRRPLASTASAEVEVIRHSPALEPWTNPVTVSGTPTAVSVSEGVGSVITGNDWYMAYLTLTLSTTTGTNGVDTAFAVDIEAPAQIEHAAQAYLRDVCGAGTRMNENDKMISAVVTLTRGGTDVYNISGIFNCAAGESFELTMWIMGLRADDPSTAEFDIDKGTPTGFTLWRQRPTTAAHILNGAFSVNMGDGTTFYSFSGSHSGDPLSSVSVYLRCIGLVPTVLGWYHQLAGFAMFNENGRGAQAQWGNFASVLPDSTPISENQGNSAVLMHHDMADATETATYKRFDWTATFNESPANSFSLPMTGQYVLVGGLFFGRFSTNNYSTDIGTLNSPTVDVTYTLPAGFEIIGTYITGIGSSWGGSSGSGRSWIQAIQYVDSTHFRLKAWGAIPDTVFYPLMFVVFPYTYTPPA